MIKIFCNACERQLSELEIENSARNSAKWLGSNLGMTYILTTDDVQDVFCKNHIAKAEDYWDQKINRVADLKKHVSKTLRNNCRGYFSLKPQKVDSQPRRVEPLASPAISRQA
jgi:ribosomal protein S17E